MGSGPSKPEQNNPSQNEPDRSKPWQRKPKNNGQTVHCIPEGTGGTFWIQSRRSRRPKPKHGTFHRLGDEELIGTENCKAGLGVYFEIGDNMCFCAHMHVTVAGRGSRATPDEDQYKEIVKMVRMKLEVESETAEWRASSVHKNSLILICPQAQFGGTAAAEGVLDFLKMRGTHAYGRGILSYTEHGFVVKPFQPDSKLGMEYDHTKRDDTEACKPLNGFNMVDQKLSRDEWCYNCRDSWPVPKRRFNI